MASVAQLIERHHEQIVSAWTQQARQFASARGLDEPALRNIMPVYLSSLKDSSADEHRKYVDIHLASRVRQGFQLAEIIGELAILERCIVELWLGEPLVERPSLEDARELRTEIHRATLQVIEMFTAHMLDDEQIEKRYLRLVQDIASEALHPGAPALRGRLQEVLALVSEALAAPAAAFMVATSTRELVTIACVGLDSLAGYTTSLGSRSFAAEVARSEPPVEVVDTSRASLEVPPAVRTVSLGALLGVRLHSRQGLLGVMFVAQTAPRSFTAREHRRLESLAAHLTLHLDNAALFASLAEKVEALRAERELRERFIAVLAHDLRGPLGAARLASELAHDSLPKSARGIAERVTANIDRVDRMIRDLLDANRIRAGEPPVLAIAECDLCPIAQEIIEELGAQHGERFALECDDNLRGFWSAEELRRAIWNLLENAVKYGAPRRPITLAVHVVGETVRIAVHNWGPPIPAADVDHLFEAFARGSAVANRRGWGLGLAFVRACAESHGGTVSVTSTAELGTTFIIELPVDARSLLQRAPTSTRASIH